MSKPKHMPPELWDVINETVADLPREDWHTYAIVADDDKVTIWEITRLMEEYKDDEIAANNLRKMIRRGKFLVFYVPDDGEHVSLYITEKRMN